jgi:hypothetical protein
MNPEANWFKNQLCPSIRLSRLRAAVQYNRIKVFLSYFDMLYIGSSPRGPSFSPVRTGLREPEKENLHQNRQVCIVQVINRKEH